MILPGGKPMAGVAATSKVLNYGLNKGLNAAYQGAKGLSTETVQSLAPKMGKFGQKLIDAAARGGTSLAASHYVLMNTNPEYSSLYNMTQDKTNSSDEDNSDGQ